MAAEYISIPSNRHVPPNIHRCFSCLRHGRCRNKSNYSPTFHALTNVEDWASPILPSLWNHATVYSRTRTARSHVLLRWATCDERLLGIALRYDFRFLVSHFWLLSEATASLRVHFSRHRHPPSGIRKGFYPFRSLFLEEGPVHSGRELGPFPYTIFTFPPTEKFSRFDGGSTFFGFSYAFLDISKLLIPFLFAHSPPPHQHQRVRRRMAKSIMPLPIGHSRPFANFPAAIGHCDRHFHVIAAA